MLEYIVALSYDKYLKLSQLVRVGVTEVNDRKSPANVLLVVFSLVFIGVFRLFGTKCGYPLTYW